MPPDIERPEAAAAWVSYYLRKDRSDLGPLPCWLQEGGCHGDLVAPAGYEQELRERMEE